VPARPLFGVNALFRIIIGSTAAALVLALVACMGRAGAPYVPDAPLALSDSVEPQAASPVKISAKSLALLGTGAESTSRVTVSEKKYTGKFKIKNSCKGIATLKAAKPKRGKFSLSATALKAGTCVVTVTDAKKHKATLAITVTTVSIVLDGPLPAGAAQAVIHLLTVNGKPPPTTIASIATANVAACGSACTVAGPQSPAGTDIFTSTITNTAGTTLVSAGPVTATVKAGANTVVTMGIPVATPSPSPVPSSSPTPIPPTPVPSPTPGTIVAGPTTIVVCPKSGANQCTPDSALVTINQPNFTGLFVESDNCAASVAIVRKLSQNGSAAKYEVDGQSTLGGCIARFSGAGTQQATVTISVEQPGVVINANH
jgi:hypothetical protein